MDGTPVFHATTATEAGYLDLHLFQYRRTLVFPQLHFLTRRRGRTVQLAWLGGPESEAQRRQLAMLHRFGEDTRHQCWLRSTLGRIIHELHNDQTEIGLSLALEFGCWTLALHVESKERPGLGSCRVRSAGGGLLRGLASLELYMGLAGVCWPWFACLFARDIGWRMVHGGPEIRTRAQYPTHQT